MTITLLSISDDFVLINGGVTLVVPMDCSMIWVKSILMPSKAREKN